MRNFPGLFSLQRCRLFTSVTIFTWGGNFKHLFFVKWKRKRVLHVLHVALLYVSQTRRTCRFVCFFISIDFSDEDEINIKNKYQSSKWPTISYSVCSPRKTVLLQTLPRERANQLQCHIVKRWKHSIINSDCKKKDLHTAKLWYISKAKKVWRAYIDPTGTDVLFPVSFLHH